MNDQMYPMVVQVSNYDVDAARIRLFQSLPETPDIPHGEVLADFVLTLDGVQALISGLKSYLAESS